MFCTELANGNALGRSKIELNTDGDKMGPGGNGDKLKTRKKGGEGDWKAG
jgi:hypothetical protein